jgi:peptidoglycan L-alanyl-D-glutamate endopeptidase CwlK
MMTRTFAPVSAEKLKTAHPDLQVLFNEVIKYWDCTVIEGHRGKEAQNLAFANGRSKVKFPKGKHNSEPSLAVDVAPFPVNWSKPKNFLFFGGFVLGVAEMLRADGRIKSEIRYGGDWNGNKDTSDNSFDDLVHFEIKK